MRESGKMFVFLFAVLIVQCSAMSLSELEDFANFLRKTSQLDDTLKKGTDINDFDEDDVISDQAWEDSGKFEGDLILNERQRRVIVEDIAEGLSRNGLRDSTKRWPDNELVYYIQREHFSGDQIQAIQDGIEDLARASCVKFRPYRKGDRDAVVIQGSKRGCFSQVGYQGGYQVLNLSGRHPVGRGCFRHGTIVHEMLHALGFYHMQSSVDRDDYVDIAWENIAQQARHNFRKYNAGSVTDFGVSYDYDSVMHYSRRAFSSNGKDTIIPKQRGAEIGQRTGLSDKDAQKLNKMYCDADSNENSDSLSQKSPNKRKSPKNKPFQGHGIGYHQGKTVVIKLSPSAETYRILNKPSIPMFDHSSKAPQVVPPKESAGFGPGRGIADTYTPPTYTEDYNNQARKEVQDLNGVIEVNTNRAGNTNVVVTEAIEDTPKDTSNLQTKPDNKIEKSNKSSKDEHEELRDILKRLTKILKTHVYPTNLPNLTPYGPNNDYSEFGDPNKTPKIAFDFVTERSKEKQDIEESPKSEYIQSLYIDGPKSIHQGKHTYDKKPQKIVKDTISKEIQTKAKIMEENDKGKDVTEVDNFHYNNVVPQIEHRSFDKLQNPKEMYELVLNPQIPKEAEAVYRTSYPFKVHQTVSNGSLELKTPDYALYENLKDKNNYSSLYLPLSQQDDETTEKHYSTFGDTVPTYDNWYQKDYLKRNPVDYDRASYTYLSPESKSNIRVYDDTESSEFDPSEGSKYTGSFSPRTKQAYTLYGEPVPLTRNWYKVDSQKLIEYPYEHYQPNDSESYEDKR